MDIWDLYIKALSEAMGSDKIVIDRFHVIKHMNKAVDEVRKLEVKQLNAQGDNYLKGSKFMWLHLEENTPEHKKASFELLKNRQLKVTTAWAVKEMLRDLWNSINLKSAIHYFLQWFQWARNTGLKALKKAADTVANHVDHILTYFKHRITNATSEVQ